MDIKDLAQLEGDLKFASYIEQCQDKGLITAEDRAAYSSELNEKVHAEIERLLDLTT